MPLVSEKVVIDGRLVTRFNGNNRAGGREAAPGQRAAGRSFRPVRSKSKQAQARAKKATEKQLELKVNDG